MQLQSDPGLYTPRWRAQVPGVDVTRQRAERVDDVLTERALQLLALLHRRFNTRREELLAARARRQVRFDAGQQPDFLPETAAVRASDWRVAPVPDALRDRRNVLAGPADRKTIVNALQAPVRVFIADFEDGLTPTWQNLIAGQLAVSDVLTERIGNRAHGKRLTLMLRPRGWHLPEKHVRIDGESVAGALFDVALYLANHAQVFAQPGQSPCFSLPKLESHLEARLWSDVFTVVEEQLRLPRGTIRARVLIETLPAAFEMDEVLHALRDYAVGLDFDRADYLFSYLKTFRRRSDMTVPDRTAVRVDEPLLKSCLELLARTCQRRGAHCMEGAAPGTAVVGAAQLLQPPTGAVTEAGLRQSIRVGVRYIESWLSGTGSVSLYQHLETVAGAELCRSQLWQWLRHGTRTEDGQPVTVERLHRVLLSEIERIHREVGGARMLAGVFPSAARLFASAVTSDTFDEFLTLPAYELLG